MGWTLETMGNATILIGRDGCPLLATDPWLDGTAYFGSWALERPLTERQRHDIESCPFIWFSHGHPDHFHVPSVDLLPRTAEMLLPDHFRPELREVLDERGFRTRVLPSKNWVELTNGLKVLSVANENMDAILAVEAGSTLVVNKNDSPFCGEEPFFRRLVRRYDRSYLLALCSNDADMLNLFDATLRPIAPPPDAMKPGTVWAISKTCEKLGFKNFCCSSSQHIYVREDSAWANAHRITFADMQRWWATDRVRLVPPFVVVDLERGQVEQAAPAAAPPPAQGTGEDDWSERLSESEWREVEDFVRSFETLGRRQEFIAFTVGGETRRYSISKRLVRRPAERQRGVNFIVPRRSLLETVRAGYFDDLLIGNFMKTQLYNMTLYPHFSPRIAKLGGNARARSAAEVRRFYLHYFRRSPMAFMRYHAQMLVEYSLVPAVGEAARRVGLFGVLKRLKARLIGAPRLS